MCHPRTLAGINLAAAMPSTLGESEVQKTLNLFAVLVVMLLLVAVAMPAQAGLILSERSCGASCPAAVDNGLADDFEEADFFGLCGLAC